MKRDFFKIRKRIIVGCLAAAIAVVQPVSSVFANPHYDRRDTVAEEEFIYSARTSGTESSRKKVNSKAWKKINGVCYNGSGKIIPGAITRGMDVSEWQGNIDWKQVKKSDIDFAFVRISYGLTHEDYTYDENIDKCRTCRSTHGHLCVQYSLIDNYRIKGSTACHQQNAGLQGFLSGRI